MIEQNENINTAATGIEVIHKRFQDLYISLRNSEKRMYSDEEVLQLPEVHDDHQYRDEWKMRKDSAKKLVNYLIKKNRPLKILEVGCGNGWLSNQLAGIKYTVVTGVDINLVELQQATRVFVLQDNLSFVYGDISAGLMTGEKFDIIVFAASVQYFQSFRGVMNIVLELLCDGGEIHILDSHFYAMENLEAARERSRVYFKEMGFENMSKLYFHHSFDELQAFNYEILYDPNALVNKFLGKKNPFNWICIKAKK
jgi:SAM-dependent methyltransferase